MVEIGLVRYFTVYIKNFLGEACPPDPRIARYTRNLAPPEIIPGCAPKSWNLC